MVILQADQDDTRWLSDIIAKEFPYTKATPQNVGIRLKKQNFFLFKLVEHSERIGFIEIELLQKSPGVARINGISIEKKYRGKGYAKKLLDFSIGFLERLRVNDITLIVRQDNEAAKKLYEKMGFLNLGLSEKTIEGKPVETMHYNINKRSAEQYLN